MTNLAFFDDCKTFRQRAGLTISELARAAGVDRTTISKIEKHHAARYETLMCVINALNSSHYAANGAAVDPSVVLSMTSRFGVAVHT